MVAAIGDSGMLSFLRDPKKVKDPKKLSCDPMPLQLTIKLDQAEITAQVETEADSPERASEMASGYNGLLTVGQFARRGKDEEVLYRNTKVTSEGKQILVNFSMPRQTASEMLKKQSPGRINISVGPLNHWIIGSLFELAKTPLIQRLND